MVDIIQITEHFPYAGLFMLLILGGLGLPLPEDTTLMLCGFLVFHHVIKLIPALLVVYAGLLIADFIVYSFGRKYGVKIVNHKYFQKIISPGRLSMLEDKFREKGVYIILLGRHMLGFRVQIFLTAGVMRMQALKFVAADALSSLFTIAVMVSIGYAGGNSLDTLQKDFKRVEHFIILAAVIVFALYLVYKFIRSRREEPS
jgi:membrane protein DedA with SNARE-associated domain